MSCIDEILNRRSIRRFRNEPVGEDVMSSILEAGRRAPSATNQQPWHFVVARDYTAKEACTYQGFNRFVTEAPFVVVGLYTHHSLNSRALWWNWLVRQNEILVDGNRQLEQCQDVVL
jgi:hypothetical protein